MQKHVPNSSDAYGTLAVIAFIFVLALMCGMSWTIIVPAITVGWVALVLNGA